MEDIIILLLGYFAGLSTGIIISYFFTKKYIKKRTVLKSEAVPEGEEEVKGMGEQGEEQGEEEEPKE